MPYQTINIGKKNQSTLSIWPIIPFLSGLGALFLCLECGCDLCLECRSDLCLKFGPDLCLCV